MVMYLRMFRIYRVFTEYENYLKLRKHEILKLESHTVSNS
jgi:hypothetical protein